MCINCFFFYKHCKISKQLLCNKQNVSRNICPLKIKFLKHLEENFRFIMYTCTLLAAIGKVVKEILSYLISSIVHPILRVKQALCYSILS